MAIFDYSHNESTFSFPEFLPACKKSVYLSIHLLTQFLGPVTRLATTIFDHVYPAIFLISFSFLRICINMQEISLFQMFILQIQSILEYRDQIVLTYILTNPNKKMSNFNFCEFVSTCEKWGCFIDLLWRNSWFNNFTIRWEHFGLYLRAFSQI